MVRCAIIRRPTLPTRNRSRSKTVQGGTSTWNGVGGLSPSPSSSVFAETCFDVVGNPDGANPFICTKTTQMAWICHGRSAPSNSSWNYNGRFHGAFPGSLNAPSTTQPSNNDSLALALARTNPNKPNVDLPVFAYELREIPRQIKTWGDRLIALFPEEARRQRRRRPWRDVDESALEPLKAAAQGFLEWTFGWDLLIRDVSTMMQFVNLTEKRFWEFKRMQRGARGLGRSTVVWNDSSAQEGPWTTYATALYSEANTIKFSWETIRNKWVSTMWRPTVDLKHMTDRELLDRANRAVFGLELSTATLWEAMPWSWLIDWFSNVGDILQNSRNSLPVETSGSCVMLHSRKQLKQFAFVGGPAWATAVASFTPAPWAVIDRKERTPMVGLPLPELRMPFLNGKQLSILGAILATRLI